MGEQDDDVFFLFFLRFDVAIKIKKTQNQTEALVRKKMLLTEAKNSRTIKPVPTF